MPFPTPIILGSRASPLALAQTELILNALQSLHPHLTFTIRTFTTHGDSLQSLPDALQPPTFEKGWFTGALETALLENQAHIVVHSLKDLPITPSHPTLTIAATPPRAPAHDILIAKSPLPSSNPLLDIPKNATVGTSSPRRQAQIKTIRPDLQPQPLRGNIGTRIQKLLHTPTLHAIILAQAGLCRLPLPIPPTLHIAPIPIHTLLPAPGQGALAIQTLTQHSHILPLLAPLHHPPTHHATTAERALLAALGGGCLAPIAAHAQYTTTQATLHAFYLPNPQSPPRTLAITASPNTDPITLSNRLARLLTQT